MALDGQLVSTEDARQDGFPSVFVDRPSRPLGSGKRLIQVLSVCVGWRDWGLMPLSDQDEVNNSVEAYRVRCHGKNGPHVTCIAEFDSESVLGTGSGASLCGERVGEGSSSCLRSRRKCLP